jgi:hypothetical protein
MTNLQHELDRVITDHGHAAVATHLAAVVGWQGRHYSQAQAVRIARAAELLAEAAQMLELLEAEDVSHAAT